MNNKQLNKNLFIKSKKENLTGIKGIFIRKGKIELNGKKLKNSHKDYVIQNLPLIYIIVAMLNTNLILSFIFHANAEYGVLRKKDS